MKFLSFDIIKGKDLCYCNVEAKFHVEKQNDQKSTTKSLLRSPL